MACKGSGVQIPSAPHNFMKSFVLETKELLLSQGVIAILAIIQIRVVATNLGPEVYGCLLYTSPSPRDLSTSRMPSSA